VNDMLYNLEELIDLVEGDEELLLSILRQFVIDITRSVNNISESATLGDAKVVLFNTHRIKPAIESLKISSLKPLIIQIDSFVEAGNYGSDLEEVVGLLRSIVADVIADLKLKFKL
jgi:hypothetical protein